ncbi:MAG: PilZ domain-containing protein [Thermodesulfovibrionales bacterium]
MSKRKHVRFVRRLETEFSAEGKNYRGISSDLSCNGLFIRTNHAFPPGTALAITIHLPDGATSTLKGRVRRALRTTVVSLKNGMGVELIEKDYHYTDFMLNFTKDCEEVAHKDHVRMEPQTSPQPEHKTDTAAPEFLIIACASCGVKNKVNVLRIAQGPKCGKCGATLQAV